MLYYLFTTLFVLTCVVLMITILLQQGKGGDIANAFGGGSSQAVFGARAGATVLTKVTTGLTVAFMVLALSLAVMGSRGTSSVVGGLEGPAPVTLPAGALTPSVPAPSATTPPAATTTPAAPPATATPAPAPSAGTAAPPAAPPPAKKP